MGVPIRLAGTVDGSIVDGPGIRYAVFFQGCDKRCPGCHNEQTQDYEGGCIVSTDKVIESIRSNPMIAGVTFTGGEPFDQPEALWQLCRNLADDYDLWAYTGYTYEQLRERKDTTTDLILNCYLNVLVDGPYIEEQKSLSLPWRGSANQRILNLKEVER